MHNRIFTPVIKISGKKEVNPEDVVFLKADINYTEVVLQDGERMIVSKTLKRLEKSFLPFSFFRTHKSFMVNLNYVTGYHVHEEMIVKLHNDASVSLSRRRKDEFLKLYKKKKLN
jgi:two-component system LytT family response regulator